MAGEELIILGGSGRRWLKEREPIRKTVKGWILRREHDFLTKFRDTTFTSWNGVLRWSWSLEWFQQDWKWCPPGRC